MEVDVNPAGVADAYLTHLNVSFNGWGDAARYRWVFERTAGAPAADLMVLREEAKVLAGSAVSYRNAALPNGRRERVGIMTGSWTLPASRGRGCFARIIHESLALCRQRDAALLLAFVTEDNTSYRRLRDAGATLVETSYWVVSPPEALPDAPTELKTGALVPTLALHRAHEERTAAGLRFTYDGPSYGGQFLQRPTRTEVAESDEGVAVLERAPGTDRVLALYPVAGRGPALVAQLCAHAHAARRTLFGFTSNAICMAWFQALGVAPKRGFMTVMAVSGTNHPQVAPLSLENGDRM